MGLLGAPVVVDISMPPAMLDCAPRGQQEKLGGAMPVVRSGADKEARTLAPSQFLNEQDLENALANHWQLIVDDDTEEAPVRLVQRQVPLGDAGIADLLFVDASGLPIVVEVKLKANAQSRRDVVAQVFDYVSSLSLLTAEQLDDTVDGALLEAVNSFPDEERDDAAHDRWRSCAANLRAGKARVIVAVDEAPDELTRIMRFLNDHSDLDVRLVTVRQYPDPTTGQTVYVSNVVTHTPSEDGLTRNKKPLRAGFKDVLDAYARIAEPGFELSGRAASYRKVSTPGWNRGKAHYEFMDLGDGVGLEIHFEPKQFWRSEIVAQASELKTPVEALFPGKTVEWVSPWTWGHRLSVSMDATSSPDQIAAGMKTLIAGTSAAVEKLLAQQEAGGIANRPSGK